MILSRLSMGGGGLIGYVGVERGRTEGATTRLAARMRSSNKDAHRGRFVSLKYKLDSYSWSCISLAVVCVHL